MSIFMPFRVYRFEIGLDLNTSFTTRADMFTRCVNFKVFQVFSEITDMTLTCFMDLRIDSNFPQHIAMI